jgi:hypothetical protein
MSPKAAYIFFSLILVFDSAYAWQEGKTEVFPLDCPSLIKNGADHLHLEITAESGSYGVPYLVGSKDSKNIWKVRFPANEVNLAKFGYSCKNNTITVSHADPGPNSYHYQEFIWDGSFIERRVKFEKDSDNWSVYKETSPSQSDRFRFWAKEGQTVKVEMSNIYAPSIFKAFKAGSPKPLHVNEFGKEKIVWNYTLKTTGDYVIVIDGTADDSRYYVRLWIN